MGKDTYSLKTIKGEPLTAVVFVMDYLQLMFNSDILTITTYPEVIINGEKYYWNEFGFRDAICSLITNKVRSSKISEKEIVINFKNNSKIIVPLEGDYPGNEAVIFNAGRPGPWWVLHQI